jgi:hypothetical protein
MPRVRRSLQVWNPFLRDQPGFLGKLLLQGPPGGNTTTVVSLVWWQSLTQWRAIPAASIAAAQESFVAAYGSQPVPLPTVAPSGDGWSILGAVMA